MKSDEKLNSLSNFNGNVLLFNSKQASECGVTVFSCCHLRSHANTFNIHIHAWFLLNWAGRTIHRCSRGSCPKRTLEAVVWRRPRVNNTASSRHEATYYCYFSVCHEGRSIFYTFLLWGRGPAGGCKAETYCGFTQALLVLASGMWSWRPRYAHPPRPDWCLEEAPPRPLRLFY